jgi:D-glycero-alpha-D-manno-heptose-7-phosphate kinase
MLYVARAPLRIDFGGGWTDVPIFAEAEGGAVLNAAITLYVRGSISRPDQTGLLRKIRGERSRLSYVVDVPTGAGLGASAAQTVVWVTLVRTTIANTADRYHVAEIACKIKDSLDIVGGKQDEFASALGGIAFYSFTDTVVVERLSLDASFTEEFRRRLVLVYTGKRRNSSDVHEAVWTRYRTGDPVVVSALRTLKRIAAEMKTSLENRDLDTFGRLMGETWEQQKLLHPSVDDPRLSEVFALGNGGGALGGKACGAGGGGCAIFLARPGEEGRLRDALSAPGFQIINFDFDTYGVHLKKG